MRNTSLTTVKSQAFIARLSEIVEANIANDKLDMAFIQDKMNMSYSSLYRAIRTHTSMGGNEFIRKMRLKHSVRLLLDGYTVAEAAWESGFNDRAYFRKCFKEEFGIAPSRYVKSVL